MLSLWVIMWLGEGMIGLMEPLYDNYYFLFLQKIFVEGTVSRLDDKIMEKALESFKDHSGFLFETAQYHARKCEYEKAIAYYERSWALEEAQKPRFTDALDGIATIYEIVGDMAKALETVDRKIACLKEEWGYKDGDAVVLEAEAQKNRLLK